MRANKVFFIKDIDSHYVIYCLGIRIQIKHKSRFKYKEATELTNRTQVCTGKGSGDGNGSTIPFGCFQTMGDLWIDFTNKEAAQYEGLQNGRN